MVLSKETNNFGKHHANIHWDVTKDNIFAARRNLSCIQMRSQMCPLISSIVYTNLRNPVLCLTDVCRASDVLLVVILSD